MLPFLNSSSGKAKKQIVSFRGINFSDQYTDGDMRDCMNMSARRYPYLTTRRARKQIEEHTGATAFLYRDKPIVVIGTDLIYDGNVVAQVTEGEKQFAIVNTKLCVFPDKIYYDVKTGETGKLDRGVNSAVGAHDLVVTRGLIDNEIVSTISTQDLSELDEEVSLYDGGQGHIPVTWKVYTYGKNYQALEKCWKNGAWDETLLSELEEEKTIDVSDGYFVIPNSNRRITWSGGKQVKEYGNGGLYAKITLIGAVTTSSTVPYASFYKVGDAHSFVDVFKTGDAVTITGTRGGIYDTEKALLSLVEKNKLTFGGDVFNVIMNGDNIIDDVHSASIVFTDLRQGNYYVTLQYTKGLPSGWNAGASLRFTATKAIPEKYSIFIRKSDLSNYVAGTIGIYVLDLATRDVTKYQATLYKDGKPEDESYINKGNLYEITRSETTNTAINFAKPYPELDFVCESENRLWGCSNKDQTIYASALGDPTNFFVYEGLSTDGYAVAVGTEGEFTGCCKHSSSVLFWKETKLHKILGSFPAEYAMYSYDIEGLQKGSHKSMQIINDVLFFLGNNGVYAFSGGVPTLVSSNFGETRLEKGVAGNDGDTYYLSAWEGDTCHLLLFETKSGQWLKEDATNAVDFARAGKDLYMLDDTGKVWLMDAKEDDPEIEWMAHFTPFYETIEGRKMFSKLLMRLELPKGAWMKAEIRCDDGLWRESGKVLGRDNDTVPLYLPINRCDKLEIRLSGHGPCTILAMMLEYTMGSDV